MIRVDERELPAVYQFLQSVGEFTSSLAVQAQLANQLFEAGPLFGLAFDVPKNGVIGGSGQSGYLGAFSAGRYFCDNTSI
jgi:hypothetical protein